MNYLILMLLFAMTIFAQTKNNEIQSLIKKGEFAKAKMKIDSLVHSGKLSEEEKLSLLFEKERMGRIKKDFRLTEDKLLKYIRKYIPSAGSSDLLKWEKDGSLEYKIIDGKKFYFNRAHTNFFLINKTAKKIKANLEKTSRDKFRDFLKKYIEEIQQEPTSIENNLLSPVRMELNYTLKVNRNAVPPGEILRCWLPYPREGRSRQTNIELISVNADEYIIASNKHLQRTVYFEKTAEKDSETIFNVKFKLKSFAQKFKIKPEQIKPYKTQSEFYNKYTSERAPHIVFTDKIKKLSKDIIGDEQNPYLKAKKIFTWISENIPWAGAREYSTIRNISDYCITNMHGDCGIKSLLFITLCRYNGIPAKWQSGWMLHPGFVNLHDWAEIYFEGIGWIPVDQSFGLIDSENEFIKYFYFGGIDAYHLIINDDFSQPLFPAKIFPRSETVDFQRGEVEWRGGNLYFDKWDYDMEIEYK